MQTAYIGLGANLGDARQTLEAAASALGQQEGIQLLALSAFYRSAPVAATGPDYVNAVAQINTNLTAHELLAALQAIEQQFGRQRPYPNAPRTLDLDLLLFGQETINSANLIVPHPRMHLRAFVLQPLADLAPTLQLAQGSLPDLLAACSDQAIEKL